MGFSHVESGHLLDRPIMLKGMSKFTNDLEQGVTGVVLACGGEPVSDLLTSLSDVDTTIVGVGDCMAPRTVEEAVLEGLTAASTL